MFASIMMLSARIHQVRSRGNNIAVNVWWRHRLNADVDVDSCRRHDNDNGVDQSLTLDKLALLRDKSGGDDTQSLRLALLAVVKVSTSGGDDTQSLRLACRETLILYSLQ